MCDSHYNSYKDVYFFFNKNDVSISSSPHSILFSLWRNKEKHMNPGPGVLVAMLFAVFLLHFAWYHWSTLITDTD